MLYEVITPELVEPCAEKHDRPFRQRAVRLLPIENVLCCEAVVMICRRGLRHVDHGCWSDQPVERDLVDRLLPFCEVDRRIEMRPAMFRQRNIVGRIEPSTRVLAVFDSYNFV